MEKLQTGFPISAEPVRENHPTGTDPSGNTGEARPFSEVLQETAVGKEAGELKFSKHAVKRLGDRNISLSESQNRRLSEGVARAEEKGINDSLVMLDSMAFIVNVPSQTVVTALDQKEAGDHIYTNIDGAVIA